MIQTAKIRQYAEGIGEAVADRTINRMVTVNGEHRRENWGEVAHRVSVGNSMLHKGTAGEQLAEFTPMYHHLSQASLLMSGRHLQHGDDTQPSRNMELFTNCSTAPMSFISFYLLLNGSGVGRSYDDEMMLVDWKYMPDVRCVINGGHADVLSGEIKGINLRTALHVYSDREVEVYTVQDSREGWAYAVGRIEAMAYEKKHRGTVLLLDFSEVRPRGTPIGGMQDRPASGPGPLISAIENISHIKNTKMEPWKATMFVDHYLAECVLVGGARRAARMATKTWRDKNVIEFIKIKRAIELEGLAGSECTEWVRSHPASNFLYSSNNSVMVDEKFWEFVKSAHGGATFSTNYKGAGIAHALNVLNTAVECAYYDGTGEPGFINADKLNTNMEGADYSDGMYADSIRFKMPPETLGLARALAKVAFGSSSPMIVNPCVTGDTWVDTEDGPRQVLELIDNPFNALVDGEVYPSTGFWKTGDKTVLTLKTNRGQELRLTEDHKVLVEASRKQRLHGGYTVEHEWVEAGNLEPGDKVVLNDLSGFNLITNEVEFDKGWMLGEIVGDGGYNPAKYPTYMRFWKQSNGQNMASIAELAYCNIENAVAPLEHSGNCTYNPINSTYTLVARSLDALADGLITRGDKRLTPDLEKMPESFVAGFVRGMFDSDGCVQGSSNKGLSVRLAQSGEIGLSRLRSIQRMLGRFGIICTIYENRKPAGKWKGDGDYDTQPCHELVISKSNIIVYKNKIGFYDAEKSQKLDFILSEYSDRGLYAERFTACVESIETSGVEAVYDCTVDEVHRFGANGIIVHNCGEIVLYKLGAYCTIADVVPFHAQNDEDAEDAFRTAVRALIRVNTMDALFAREVRRTNRIGVGMTGLHEYAFSRFGLGWMDLVDEQRSINFWQMLSRFKRAIVNEAKTYSAKIGVVTPHTNTTMKPAGTTSKLFGLSEGAHLPSMREYLRWVQFREGDPLIAEYESKGYPVRHLTIYKGTTIVGFPTRPTICDLGMGDKLVTAAEASPESQYRYLELLEKYWIVGVEEDGVTPLACSGNQVSYTLKYKPGELSFEDFKRKLIDGQSRVRCCSVMPQDDGAAYEYMPEEGLNKAEFEAISAAIIRSDMKEDIGLEHVDCGTGACPIDFNKAA